MGNNGEEGDLAEQLLIIEKPRSWWHLLHTLYRVDEYKLLRLQNADGYFYLLFLKRCYQLFALLTIWSFLVLMPCYTVWYDQKYEIGPVGWGLGKLTVADSLQNP